MATLRDQLGKCGAMLGERSLSGGHKCRTSLLAHAAGQDARLVANAMATAASIGSSVIATTTGNAEAIRTATMRSTTPQDGDGYERQSWQLTRSARSACFTTASNLQTPWITSSPFESVGLDWIGKTFKACVAAVIRVSRPVSDCVGRVRQGYT
jgi:hypothetical protein